MITVDTPAVPSQPPAVGMIPGDSPACRPVTMPLAAEVQPPSARPAVVVRTVGAVAVPAGEADPLPARPTGPQVGRMRG